MKKSFLHLFVIMMACCLFSGCGDMLYQYTNQNAENRVQDVWPVYPHASKKLIPLNVVGASKSALRDFKQEDYAAKSIFVSQTNGNDSNLGTEVNPLKTIAHARTLIAPDKNYIIIMDSATYTEPGFVVNNTNFKGLLAAEEQNPLVQFNKPVLSTCTVDPAECAPDAPERYIEDSEIVYSHILPLTDKFVSCYYSSRQKKAYLAFYKNDYKEGDKPLSKIFFYQSAGNIPERNFRCSLLSNGRIGVVLADSRENEVILFIFDEQGNKLHEKRFPDDSKIKTFTELSNGNLLILQEISKDGYYRYVFRVLDHDGNEIRYVESADGDNFKYLDITALQNKFVLFLSDKNNSYKAARIIFNNDGTEAVAFENLNLKSKANFTCTLSNGDFIWFYSDDYDRSSDDLGHFKIYDGRTFAEKENGQIDNFSEMISVIPLEGRNPAYGNKNYWAACFRDDTSSHYPRLCIYKDTTKLYNEVVWNKGGRNLGYLSAAILSNGTLIYNVLNKNKAYFKLYDIGSWNAVKIETPFKIDGVSFTMASLPGMKYLFDVFAQLDFGYSNIARIANPAGTCSVIHTSAPLHVYNSKFFFNDNVIFSSANLLKVENSQFFANALNAENVFAVECSGVAAINEDILFNHCDFVKGKDCLKLSHDNNNVYIKNSNFADNYGKAIESVSGAQLRYVLSNSSVEGVDYPHNTDEELYYRSYPAYYFDNTGLAIDEINLNLQYSYLVDQGVFVNSPAVQTGELKNGRRRNLGSLDVKYEDLPIPEGWTRPK